MVVQHNLSAMNSMRMLGLTTMAVAGVTEKLSSGYKVNRAADDAAGLAISEKMRRQIRGLTQASANCQDGVSLVQIADGAMAEIHDMLHRGTELSVKAANGTLTDDDRSYIQAEIDSLKEEIQAIREKANFNEIPVLKGGQPEYTKGGYEVVGGLPAAITAKSPDLTAGKFSTKGDILGDGSDYAYGVIDFTDLTNIQDLVGSGFHTCCATCDKQYSIQFVDEVGNTKDTSNGSHPIFNIGIKGMTSVDQVVSAISSISTGHFASFKPDATDAKKLLIYDNRDDTPDYYLSHTTMKPGVAKAISDDPTAVPDIIIQAGAENDPAQQIKIILPAVSLNTLGITNTNVNTENNARAAIDDFKNAIAHVSKERSRMGAYQNRLEHTIKNLDNVVENTTSAESSIRDTDMATAMVRYSNLNILAQAGQSMLAQANQSNQGVLSLLQ